MQFYFLLMSFLMNLEEIYCFGFIGKIFNQNDFLIRLILQGMIQFQNWRG